MPLRFIHKGTRISMKYTLFHGDCLNVMNDIPDASIDMVLCDLPYGTTSCRWDNTIPFEPLWEQYDRVTKDNSAIVLFGVEPFSSRLRMSNLKNFKYDWIWRKSKPSGHLNAKKQPMRAYEIISVFYKKQCDYFPQGLIEGEFDNNRPNRGNKVKGEYVHGSERCNIGLSRYTNYPINILEYSNPNHKLFHPTQKPVGLIINILNDFKSGDECETILDCFGGSGSTLIACEQLNLKCYMMELDPYYVDVIIKRWENLTGKKSEKLN